MSQFESSFGICLLNLEILLAQEIQCALTSATWQDLCSNDKAALLPSFTLACLCVATLSFCRECFLVLASSELTKLVEFLIIGGVSFSLFWTP
jgi:hypothetical protein